MSIVVLDDRGLIDPLTEYWDDVLEETSSRFSSTELAEAWCNWLARDRLASLQFDVEPVERQIYRHFHSIPDVLYVRGELTILTQLLHIRQRVMGDAKISIVRDALLVVIEDNNKRIENVSKFRAGDCHYSNGKREKPLESRVEELWNRRQRRRI